MKRRWLAVSLSIGLGLALVASVIGFAYYHTAQARQTSVLKPDAAAKKAPIAIGALPRSGEHLVPPRREVVVDWLKADQAIPLDASEDQIKAALEEYDQAFSKKSSAWTSPKVQEMVLQRENALANPGGLNAQALTIQPVTATIFALAVDFPMTETFTLLVDNGAGRCVPASVTISGTFQGQIPPPGPRDNQSVWYSPTETANVDFYKKLIFGYEGVGRVRYDLNDPVDGLPGINLEGYTVQDYYDHVAGDGNVAITGTVEGWVGVPHSQGYYGADSCLTGAPYGGGPVPAGQLIVDAATVFSASHASYYTDTSPEAFWPKFDGNQDGLLDTFWTIYAGIGQEADGGVLGAYALWSNSSDLRYYAQWPEGFKIYEGDPLTTSDDIYIGPYTMQPEQSETGVMSEEFGHNFFGWPDLYVTDYGAQTSIAFWDLMEAGAWGGYLGGAQPVGVPLWFRMIAWCGADYCNWQEPMVTRQIDSPAAEVVIGQLEKTPADVNKGIRISLPPAEEVVPAPAGHGQNAYTDTGRDNLDIRLQRAIAIPASATGRLTFDTYWDIETGWDYGYVQVVDGAQRSYVCDMAGYFTTSNPNGTNLGCGLTGWSGASTTLSFDLSAYRGKTIMLRLRYVTDSSTTMPGWWIDNVKLDGVPLDDFEGASGSTFPNWTNTTNAATGWVVAPVTKSYSNYYLVEWRSDTKYDQMVRTAYATTYYDADEWQVARIPYNIPGALVYYRNARFLGNKDLGANLYASPSIGPKYQLLVVDMNPAPLRRMGASGAYSYTYYSPIAGSYDAALTLQDTDPFTVTYTAYEAYTGTHTFAAHAPVTTFDDAQGYYPGFYSGSPCPDDLVCYVNQFGSAVIPARGDYTTKISDFDGNPVYDLYGAAIAGRPLGSGSPFADGVQYGVKFDLVKVEGADYTSLATLRFGDYNNVTFQETVAPEQLWSAGAYTITYQTVVKNHGSANGYADVAFELDPNLRLVSLTTSQSGHLNPGDIGGINFDVEIYGMDTEETVTVTLVAGGNATVDMWLQTWAYASDGPVAGHHSETPLNTLVRASLKYFLPFIVR
jgi:immune inhibitor A